MLRRKVETAEDWESVIAAATRLQRIVDGAVPVGGSGAALHVQHRFSYDDDHVVADLREQLETELVAATGGPLRIPSLPEMLRIKAWLAVTRNATRDYVHIATLAKRPHELDGPRAPVEALLSLDALYPQHSGESAIRQLTKQLAEPRPYDFESEAFGEFRGLVPPWTSWNAVIVALRELAADLAIAHAGDADS